MAAANITGSLFSAVIGIYLARTLMPEALGYLSYVFTIVFFLANFIDLGLSTYGIREVAGKKTRFADYVSEIVSFRLFVAVTLSAFFLIIAFLSPEIKLLKFLMLESASLLLVWACATEWAFQGLEEMHMIFISLAITGSLQLGLAVAFVKGPADLLNVPLIYFIGTLPVTVVFLRRLKFKFSITAESFKKMSFYLSSSMVIWSISVFAQVYNNLDVFLLGLFRSIEEVGYFTIARRIIGGFSMLMIFLANATLPRLSCTLAAKDTAEFRRATHKFVKLAVAIIFFVLLPVIIFSKQIITFTVGIYYVPASTPLSIMIAGIALVVFNLPYSTALIAACFEKEVLKQAGASAVLSIFLNFVLIPKYGMIGASISFLAAESLALGWILWIYNKKIRTHIYI